MSRATWPTNTTSGVESWRAMWMPGEALVAPGPRVTKQTPGTAGRLAHRLGHHRGAALLPANGDGNIAVVKRIDRSEIAFAGHAEHVLDAVNAQLIDQNLGGRTIIVLTAHRRLRDKAQPIRRAGRCKL